jgi:hypothetical protein
MKTRDFARRISDQIADRLRENDGGVAFGLTGVVS